MEIDPCTVCGGTDVNLVDGFYYCIECGTQDMTIRETIVEATALADGTFATGKKRKINLKKPKILMSKEWDKWHAYNFMLCGLANELVSLGAKPSFKSKVLWIWTRYIKKYHIRKEYDLNNSKKRNTLIADGDNDNDSSDDLKKNDNENSRDSNELNVQVRGIRTMSYMILYAILYVGLNLDKSDILLSHFLRYIKEGRLSYHDIIKYVPNEIKVSKIPQWSEFMISRSYMFTSFSLLKTSHMLFKNLDLGTPVIPDLKEIVKGFVKELCLPKDLKNLVFSLMEFMPVKVDMARFMNFSKVLPDYETIIMSYILMALKLCFGLDDDYDIKLSKVIDKINDEECHLKSYRVGISESSERLFSLREWLIFLEFRKIILCHLYQPMASKHDFNEDDFLISELLKDQIVHDELKRVADQLSFELLNKIPQQMPFTVISKEEFPVSLTPLTAYTEFILPRIKDSHMRLLLSEDFSRYSLKYACEDMYLKDPEIDENLIKGVREENKICNNQIVGLYRDKPCEIQSMVYVKDADNKDWIKDFTEKSDKLKKLIKKEKQSFKEFDWSDGDSDDDVPLSVIKSRIDNDVDDEKKNNVTVNAFVKLESIEELEEGQNIFNDDFGDLKDDKSDVEEEMPELVFEFSKSQIDSLNATNNEFDELRPNESFAFNETAQVNDVYDPFMFNRNEVMKMLIVKYCKRYKIPVPYKYNDRQPVKRKLDPPMTPVFIRKRAKKPEFGRCSQIIAAYHSLFPENVPKEPSNDVTNDMLLNATKTEICDEPENYSNDNFRFDDDELAEMPNEVSINIESNTELENTTPASVAVNNNDDNVRNNDFDFDLDKYLEDDKELQQIISKEILEFKNNKSSKLKLLKEKVLDKTKSKTFHDEVLKEKLEVLKKADEFRNLFVPLIKDSNRIAQFKYYVRHYKSTIIKYNLLSYTFESDLTQNFPKSFKYILMTCANMLEVSAYHLYKYFTHLEVQLLKKS